MPRHSSAFFTPLISLQIFLDQVGGIELLLQAMQDRLEGRDEVIDDVTREDCLPVYSPSHDLHRCILG